MIFGKKNKDAEAETLQRQSIIAYKFTFGSEQGRSVLFDLMDRYHILQSHKGDPYAEGQRSVVLAILVQCNINLAEFDRLLKGENPV